VKNLKVIYWSGTGNTEAMAQAVAEGAKEAGLSVDLVPVSKAKIEDVKSADLLAFGCPSMGVEVLEEDEMEPFIAALDSNDLTGKPLALFGSYDWGDQLWMRDWESRMKTLGAVLVAPGLTVQLEPGTSDLSACKNLASLLAKAGA